MRRKNIYRVKNDDSIVAWPHISDYKGCPLSVGVWLSLVEHCVRDAGVEGSNPFTPTITFSNPLG